MEERHACLIPSLCLTHLATSFQPGPDSPFLVPGSHPLLILTPRFCCLDSGFPPCPDLSLIVSAFGNSGKTLHLDCCGLSVQPRSCWQEKGGNPWRLEPEKRAQGRVRNQMEARKSGPPMGVGTQEAHLGKEAWQEAACPWQWAPGWKNLSSPTKNASSSGPANSSTLTETRACSASSAKFLRRESAFINPWHHGTISI